MIRLFRKSVTISERELEFYRPKPEDGRPIGKIRVSASLYRRFRFSDFDSSGDLIPAAFQFPKPKEREKSGQSFLLKAVACPFHALHRNCNDGRRLPPGDWTVYKLAVTAIPKQIQAETGRLFYFKVIHVPYLTCKAHCELFCSDGPYNQHYAIPSADVRAKLRIKLSRQFKPTGITFTVTPEGKAS